MWTAAQSGVGSHQLTLDGCREGLDLRDTPQQREFSRPLDRPPKGRSEPTYILKQTHFKSFPLLIPNDSSAVCPRLQTHLRSAALPIVTQECSPTPGWLGNNMHAVQLAHGVATQTLRRDVLERG